MIYCEYWENSGNSFFKEHLMGNCYWTAVTVLVFLMLPSNPCRTFAVIRFLSVLTSNQYLLAGSSVDTAVVIRRYSKKLSPRKFRKLLNTYPKCGKDFNKNACRRVYLSFVYIWRLSNFQNSPKWLFHSPINQMTKSNRVARGLHNYSHNFTKFSAAR